MPGNPETIGGGAWGLSLFQSDWDYDHLQDLSWEAGLLELEHEDAVKQGKKAAYKLQSDRMMRKECTDNHVRQNEHDHADLAAVGKKKDDELFYSIYANLCSSPKRARQWLEKTAGRPGSVSILQHMLTKHMALAVAAKDKPRRVEYKRPGYTCVLLGAAAMTLGCKLSNYFLQHLGASYTHDASVGLMRDALKQMEVALGPNGYKNDGTPYDFKSEGLQETLKAGGAPIEDRCVPGQINVPSPAGPSAFGVIQKGLAAGLIDSMKKIDLSKKKKDNNLLDGEEYGADVCGGCGAEYGRDDGALTKCSKCKSRLYCGKKCQKKEWPKHKLVCKAADV